MRFRLIVGAAAAVATVAMIATTGSTRSPHVDDGIGPQMESIGALSFGSNGVLYAADPLGATIYALELGAAPAGVAQGTADIPGIEQKIAALLGTAPTEIAIADLAVEQKTRNSYLAVMRGVGAAARPALLRVDGAGRIEVVSLDAVKFSSVTLPNAPAANPAARSNPRTQSVMDMALVNGKLWVAGLSNEEFASKLWAIPYPFVSADRGASVEIFHGNHGAVETRSPVFTFVPYTLGGEDHIIAGYLCTPLVKFPVKSLAPGAKVRGTTIAELGAGNRPIDMIMYKKDGKDFLLMSNTSRGVMKISTDRFATEPAITERVPTGTAGVPAETVASMTGIQQLDLLNATHSIVIARTTSGALNLQAVILP
jgi:hypothetical protein